MLSPEQLTIKAGRLWPKLLHATIKQAPLFPVVIPLAPPSGKLLSEKFESIHQWIKLIKAFSKRHGLSLKTNSLNNRKLGPQEIPAKVEIPNLDLLLALIGKQQEYQRFCDNWALTRQCAPGLIPWLQCNYNRMDRHGHIWPQLLNIVAYFQQRPEPQCYLRELDIIGVHSKFIEQNLLIVRRCLEQVVPAAGEVGQEILAARGIQLAQTTGGTDLTNFCRQFGLKYDQPKIRFRWLDERAGIIFSDISIPLDQFIQLQPDIDTVFITENKTNGLSFPRTPCAIVVFGLGYGIEVLKEVPWLAQKRCFYWGDIDTHGFRILNRLRRHLPTVRSLLMDYKTLMNSQPFWGVEEASIRFLGELGSLSDDERSVFEGLKSDRWQASLRMEQERVPMGRVLECLRGIQ